MQAQQLLANPLLCNNLIRDVKTVYFWEPFFYRLPKRFFVSGIIATGRSAPRLLSVRSLVASRRPWPAFQMHGRQLRETKDSGVSKQ